MEILYCKQQKMMYREGIEWAQLNYLQNKIEENKQDSKRLWLNLKSLGKSCHEKMATANEFDSYFTNVATKLVDKLPLQKTFSPQKMIVFLSFTKEKV